MPAVSILLPTNDIQPIHSSIKDHFDHMDCFFEWKFKYEGDESVWSYILARRLSEESYQEELKNGG